MKQVKMTPADGAKVEIPQGRYTVSAACENGSQNHERRQVMRQGGTMAYMSTQYSDGEGRPSGPCVPCGARNLFGGLAVPTGPQRACDREARAILAETEPPVEWDSWWSIRVAPLALAESLAAILPVLDALEAEAGK